MDRSDSPVLPDRYYASSLATDTACYNRGGSLLNNKRVIFVGSFAPEGFERTGTGLR
jgi:hypothetical protein